MLLLYGSFQTLHLLALLDVLPFFASREWMIFFGWANYVALLSGFALFKSPASFLLSYGILRRRPWAFHGIIVGLMTMPLLLFTEYLWWETFRLHLIPILVSITSFAAIVWFFTNQWVREEFGTPKFKLKSGSGAMGALVILLSFLPLLTSISLKLMFGEMAKEPQIVLRAVQGTLAEGLKPVHLMDCTVLIPVDGRLMNYDRFGFSGHSSPWRFSFRGKDVFLEYQNHFSEEEIFSELPYVRGTPFEKDHFFRTNGWNPLVLTLRSMAQAQLPDAEIFEIAVPAGNGYLTIWRRTKKNEGERIQAVFSLHNRDGKRSLAGMAILNGEGDALSELDTILSAVRFENPEEDRRAEDYFREAQTFEKEGRNLDTQVAYANAYYLSPHSGKFKIAFEATLKPGFRELAHTMEELMNERK